jgi:hypothetical protein
LSKNFNIFAIAADFPIGYRARGAAVISGFKGKKIWELNISKPVGIFNSNKMLPTDQFKVFYFFSCWI